MNESKHTPGPWSLEDDNIRPEVWVVGADKSRLVRLGQHKNWDAIDKANAKLIIAAPDLLEACKELHDLWKGDRNNCSKPGCIVCINYTTKDAEYQKLIDQIEKG